MIRYIRHNFDNTVTDREIRHKEIAYRAACEGIVLLENNGALPLKSQKVALFGIGASQTIKGGTGSGEVNERHSVSIYEGMKNAGFTVTSEAWIERYDKLYEEIKNGGSDKFTDALKKGKVGDIMALFMGTADYPYLDVTDEDMKAAPADTAFFVVSRQAGEGADRRIEKGENDLSPEEISTLQRMIKIYKNVVLVINIGSSLDMSFLDKTPGLGAVVYFCQQGTEGGHAFADIVSGKVNPSGKLTDTWAKKYSDIPFSDEYSYLNGNLKNEYYKEGLLVGYRYFDSYKIEPQYRL